MPITPVEIETVITTTDGVSLPGMLSVSDRAVGLVIFVHGSGSSRLSPRNMQVARTMIDRACATFLFDLLTESEAADRGNVFDIPLLARRVRDATTWLRTNSDSLSLWERAGVRVNVPLGYFGASTGAAAAIVASVDAEAEIAAIVSRGGRPDLAGQALSRVTAPTLFLVGSRDQQVIELNRKAQAQMRCETKLIVIEGASHLFEEPGALEQVSSHAADWFTSRFSRGN